MADTEKNEDQKISRCLQEAFGYTDEQLLKQLDQANETLKDVTFDGAEDRIMKKIMARKAELEKQTSAPELEREKYHAGKGKDGRPEGQEDCSVWKEEGAGHCSVGGSDRRDAWGDGGWEEELLL